MSVINNSSAHHQNFIEASKKGNTLAQNQLYKIYFPKMLPISISMMHNYQEAEDLLQEAFLTAFQKLNSYRFEAPFYSWLKRIVVNTCLNKIRSRKLEINLVENYDKINLVEENENDLSDIQNFQIRKTIKKLAQPYQQVIQLYVYEGYDHQEIGQILNISTENSKTRFSRAKSQIRSYLKAG